MGKWWKTRESGNCVSYQKNLVYPIFSICMGQTEVPLDKPGSSTSSRHTPGASRFLWIRPKWQRVVSTRVLMGSWLWHWNWQGRVDKGSHCSKPWSPKSVKRGNWFGDPCTEVQSRASKARDMHRYCFEKENYAAMCNGNSKGDIWLCQAPVRCVQWRGFRRLVGPYREFF